MRSCRTADRTGLVPDMKEMISLPPRIDLPNQNHNFTKHDSQSERSRRRVGGAGTAHGGPP